MSRSLLIRAGQCFNQLHGRPAFVAEIAKGMERDITASVGGTAAIIAGCFGWRTGG